MIKNNPLVTATRFCFALFVVFILLLHVLQQEISFLYDAMSYYVYGTGGWLLPASLISLGFGSLTFSLGLARKIRGLRAVTGISCMALWGVCLLVSAVFPTDPIGSWDQPPTTNGMIHFISANLAFVSVTIAALILTRELGKDSRWIPVKNGLVWMSVLSTVTFLLLMISIASIFVSNGAPLFFGLTERLFFLMVASWICIASIGLIHSEA